MHLNIMSMKQRKTAGSIGRLQRILATGLTAAVLVAAFGDTMTVYASTIKDIQNQISQDQKNLNQINNTISNLTEEQELLEEEIADLDSEIINMMTSINLKQDEITDKEGEIADKQLEIEQAERDYEAAKAKEEEQYEAVKAQLRCMYENNDFSMLATALLESADFSSLLNRAEYIERVYEYSDKLLKDYEAAKNEVQALWDQLILDKQQLENDKTQLENDKAYLQGLKAQLDSSMKKKQQESANYDAEIQRYKQDAASYAKKIQQEEKELKKLQQQQKSTANTAATSGNYTSTSYTSTVDSASGSDLGKKVAKYALQYIGNPYVYGGTSLTSGTDCSGFTYRVYRDFGYSLPRTSYEQRSAGTSVSYDQAQPGDLICYDGHVGLYIGGGKIVHASTPSSGIKVSTATYRTILSVRRII